MLTGQSAGGHLASIGGIIPESAGLDRRCPGREPVNVAAIISWYGVFDYTVLVDDPTRQYAVSWIGPQPNRMEIARLASPMTHVPPGLPPSYLRCPAAATATFHASRCSARGAQSKHSSSRMA